jgi:hypothetical protein
MCSYAICSDTDISHLFLRSVTSKVILAVTTSGVNQQNSYSGFMTGDPVELLVDFLNTVDEDTGEEELANDSDAREWLRAHGLPVRGVIGAEARRVRNALRAAADGGTPPAADLGLVPLQAAPGAGGLELTSEHPLGPLVATAVRLALEGRWDRLKLCDAETCRYAFYDGSKNRSGRWCTMSVCGNRAKTRAFRERHRG